MFEGQSTVVAQVVLSCVSIQFKVHGPILKRDNYNSTYTAVLERRSPTMEKKPSENGDALKTDNVENAPRPAPTGKVDNLSAVFENPLAVRTKEELMSDVETFCQKFDLMDFIDDFRKGALVAQSPRDAQHLTELSAEDKEVLEREHTHRWSQPFTLYWLCVMCSLAAAVQGMDETVNNGAQALYLSDLDVAGEGVTRWSPSMQDNLTGLIVGAPYLCCAIIGCWLTEPLNKVLGRRGTIFASCFVAAVASIWEGVANTWVNLFLARFVLGFGIGPKSSTVPVYAAECAPAPIRGALVMRKLLDCQLGREPKLI